MWMAKKSKFHEFSFWNLLPYYPLICFVTFVGDTFLGQTVSFGICQGVVFSCDKIHCLDPSKQPRNLANLWMLASLATQIQNAKLQLHLRSAFGFFNLASLSKILGKIALVIFQGPDNYILMMLIQQILWWHFEKMKFTAVKNIYWIGPKSK